jgi:hypothetical protein
MKLYKDDKLAEQNFNMIFDSRKDVHNAILSIITNISQKQYNNLTFDMDKKLKELDEIYNDDKDGNSNIQPMAWPIYPIDEIEIYFGDKEFENEF